MSYLGPEAAAPLASAELVGVEDIADHKICIMPVPTDAGPPGIKIDGRSPDAEYAYRGADGALLGYVLRWDARAGIDKVIRPATYWRNGGAGSWEMRTWPDARPLFGLDRLAAKPDAVVLITEGEKAAEAAEFGPLADAFTWAPEKVVAVTWPGGTNSIGCIDFSPLRGRDVIIVPDNDTPGEKAADQLVDVLQQVAVRRLRRWKAPAECRQKWDIADEPPAGIDPEKIVKSILSAPEMSAPRMVMTLAEFKDSFIPPDYLIDGLLQRHFCYSLTGATGAGKTAVALRIASLVSDRSARKLGPHEVEHGRTVYIAVENPTDVRMRLIGMEARGALDVAPDDLLVIEQIGNLDQDMPRILREVEQFGDVDLIVVDTAPAVFPGDDENSNTQSRDHAKRLRRLCDLPGRPAVVALCHPVKRVSNPDDLIPRGGGAFLAEMDGNFSLWAHDEKLADLHWTGKFRGPDFGKITFRLTTVNTMQLTDSKGRLLPTVMAELVTEAEIAATEQTGVDQENRLLQAMIDRPGAILEQWARDCRWFVNGDSAKPNKPLAHRVMKRLRDLKLVDKDGRDFVPNKAGQKAVKKAHERGEQ